MPAKRSLTFFLVDALVATRYPRNVLQFRRRVGYWPRTSLARNLNERTLWRKVFDHNPAFATLCDKLKTKAFFQERCPELPVAPTLWVGNRIEDIPDDILATPVAIKSSVASKQNLIFRRGGGNRGEIERQFNTWKARGKFGAKTLEWGYTQSINQIYAEPILTSEDGSEPLNVLVSGSNGIVVHCFAWRYLLDDHGNPVGRQGSTFYPDRSRRWCDYPLLKNEFDPLPAEYEAPLSLARACEFARELSLGLDYARYDFLCGHEVAYGGEVTIYPLSGYDAWSDPSVPRDILANWDLRKSWFLSTPQQGWRGAYARMFHHSLSELARN